MVFNNYPTQVFQNNPNSFRPWRAVLSINPHKLLKCNITECTVYRDGFMKVKFVQVSGNNLEISQT